MFLFLLERVQVEVPNTSCHSDVPVQVPLRKEAAWISLVRTLLRYGTNSAVNRPPLTSCKLVLAQLEIQPSLHFLTYISTLASWIVVYITLYQISYLWGSPPK